MPKACLATLLFAGAAHLASASTFSFALPKTSAHGVLHSTIETNRASDLMKETPCQFIDVNGDGLQDYVCHSYQSLGGMSPVYESTVLLNNGCTFLPQNSDGSFPPYCSAFMQMVQETDSWCGWGWGSGQPDDSPLAEQACPPNPDNFTTEDVARWLDSIQLSQFSAEFVAASIDGGTMNELTKTDLEEVGVKSGITKARIVGKWKVLHKEFERCLEAEEWGIAFARE